MLKVKSLVSTLRSGAMKIDGKGRGIKKLASVLPCSMAMITRFKMVQLYEIVCQIA